jgi:RNA polymerase sporulation-specific sigma factor
MKMFSAILSFLSANLLYFILHIQNSSSFPKPLSSKEEREYIKRKLEGDKQARAILIERNLRLVSHIVKKYYSKTNDTDDLISIGTIGLIKGIDSFDNSKGTRLATYASRCIENEILMYFRSLKKQSGDVMLSDAIETDKDGNPLTIEEIIADESDLADNLETKTYWQQTADYIKNMEDEREREIIILRYGLNNKKPLTQREVADRLNISRSYVSRIEKKVLNDIKKHILSD